MHVLMTNMEQKKYISKLFLHGSKLCCHISKQGEKARGGKSESQPQNNLSIELGLSIMIILKKGQSDPKIEDDTAMFYIPVEIRRCFFWALAGRFGNSWSCQKPPNHLLRETKGRNRILNEPFEHHVKLFKRKKPFTAY